MFELTLIVILVLLNGVFSATEIALVTLRRSRIQQLVDEGNKTALRVQHLKSDPGRFLAVIQIGINFLGFLASAFAAVSLVDDFAEWIATFGPLANVANALALVVVTVLLTLFTIVFGELVPKQIGLAHAERVAMSTARLMEFLGTLFGPLVAALTWVTRRIARLFRADVAADERISSEELRLIIEQGGEQGILEAEEEQMIHAVIELGEQRIHEVMVPRIAMVTLTTTVTTDEALDTIIEQGHSRIPVYEDTIDEIVGILYAKDLLPFLRPGGRTAAAASIHPADARVRARIDVGRRPAPRAPAPQGPPGDRARRVRRDGRSRHDRGPDRGDRRRDPGRVRRRGADDREACPTTRRGSTGGRRSTT